jgi:5-formyltetrahydrofolate cyclo-ligase
LFLLLLLLFLHMKAASSEMSGLKRALRTQINQKLKNLSADEVAQRSNQITERLVRMPVWQNARAVSCFVSMPTGEVQTSSVLEHATSLHSNKTLFVPKVLGKAPEEMVMLKVERVAEIEAYPKSKWGIPEAPVDGPDFTYEGIIDLVIVPGVAFDTGRHRVGHGKGYYDCFLSRINGESARRNIPRPITIALCFDEQMQPEAVPVPTEDHDVRILLYYCSSFFSCL